MYFHFKAQCINFTERGFSWVSLYSKNPIDISSATPSRLASLQRYVCHIDRQLTLIDGNASKVRQVMLIFPLFPLHPLLRFRFQFARTFQLVNLIRLPLSVASAHNFHHKCDQIAPEILLLLLLLLMLLQIRLFICGNRALRSIRNGIPFGSHKQIEIYLKFIELKGSSSSNINGSCKKSHTILISR